MRFGFHISIAGGFRKVVARAQERGCETIQVFSHNPRGWKYTELDRTDIEVFKKEIKSASIHPIFVHMPYLPNLASPNSNLFKRSIDAVVEDLRRCELIGSHYLIMHVGSSPDKEQGVRQMADGINEALFRQKNNVFLLLENTAGGGNELGYRFEQLMEIISAVDEQRRVGVVLDTAHVFEAGYDLSTQEAVARTIKEFDKIIGLKRLYLIHLNDSKTELASRVDRHWHIGKGKIGKGMRSILHHPSLKNLPFIMETPRTDLKEDLMNMKMVRKLLTD